jgi:hypothetical protein
MHSVFPLPQTASRTQEMTEPDDLEVEIQDFAPDEICELLAESGTDLSAEQAAELVRFVQETGSIEAALAALGHAGEY